MSVNISKLPNHLIVDLVKQKSWFGNSLVLKLNKNDKQGLRWQVVAPVGQFKKATDRNKAKRRIKNALLQNIKGLKFTDVDLLILAQKNCLEIDLENLKIDLNKTLKKTKFFS